MARTFWAGREAIGGRFTMGSGLKVRPWITVVGIALSLGVSLIRRARDVALGVPILLIWQFFEMRRLRGVARGAGE